MTEDHTERALRRALDDAARHVDVQAGPLPEPSFEPTEPPHRTRLAVAVGVAVVVALLAASFAFVAARDDGSSSVEIGEPTEPITSANADAWLWMREGASESDIAAVRDAFEADPDVTAYTSVDKEQMYAEFRVAVSCMPGHGVASVLASFPVSFRIRLRDDVVGAGVRDRLLLLPGVERVIMLKDPSLSDLSVPVYESTNGSATPAPTMGISPATTVAPTTLPTTTMAPITTTAPTTTTVPRVSKEIPFVLPPPPDCQEEQTTAPSEPPTTTVALPPAGDPPANPASAEAAVRDVWTRAFSASTPEAERWSMHEVFENHPELIGEGIPQNQQYRDNIAVKVLDVGFMSPTRAAVRYQLEFPALGMTQPPYLGYATLTDRGWRVATETTCALKTLGGRPCPEGT